MTNLNPNQYEPATVTPPGATLADLLEERGLRQNELATRMGVTPKFVNELIAAKATISPSTALALEKALSIPADFWLAREARFQEFRARLQDRAELEAQEEWLEELPLKDMRAFGWIDVQGEKADYVAACLEFFGVASVDAWRAHYVQKTLLSAAYRMAPRTSLASGAIAAWLRQGEIEAAKIPCKPFDRAALGATINDARALTCDDDPKSFVPKLIDSFAACGVAVVFLRAPKGCPASGAVRWLNPSRALVQLSLRYKTNDTLWFTFFHECGHILLHGKKMLFLEDGQITGDEEAQANQYAAETLIPSARWNDFRLGPYTGSRIREFAESVGVHPGIVLGRLQKEELVPWNRFAELKVRYAWVSESKKAEK